MKHIQNILLVLLLAMIISSACEEVVSYPDIPQIDYQSFTLFSTTDVLGNKILIGKLNFDFTDGDGNLGLDQPDSLNIPDSLIYNLYLNLYEKKGADFQKKETNSYLNFRIPLIEKIGSNKTLSGNITVDLEYKTLEYDTIFYSFYIVDRDFNASNVDSTDLLIFTGISLEN